MPFKTEWVEYPDIEGLCKKLGAPPTQKKRDGSPLYTVPVIYDPSTQTVVEDSWKIARYLDKTYPDTPRVIPENTGGLQAAYMSAFENAVSGHLYDLVVLAACNNLNPRSEEFFRTTREKSEGKKLEDIAPPGEEREKLLRAMYLGLNRVASWFDKNEGNGPFITGTSMTHADIATASRLIWAKVVLGEESEVWRAVVSWNGGRWDQYMKHFEKYEVLT